jgi:hypothetical protein
MIEAPQKPRTATARRQDEQAVAEPKRSAPNEPSSPEKKRGLFHRPVVVIAVAAVAIIAIVLARG